MSDDLSELERALRDKAAEVPYAQAVPRHLVARARRRVARNALSSVVAVGLVVAGASGILNLGKSPDPNVAATGGSPPACTAADLRASAALDGAAGSVVGSIGFTNRGAETCTLTGRPDVTIVSSSGDALSPHVVDVVPQWQANATSAPQGWPIVSLRPGSAASIRIRWSNPCPQLSSPARWSVDLPAGAGTLDVAGADATFPPPCNGPSEPSTLEIGPFEPSAGA